MSPIIGFWNVDGEDAPGGLLSRLSGAFPLHESKSEHTPRESDYALADCSAPDFSLSRAGNGVTVAFEGHLHNRTELVDELRAVPRSFSGATDADLASVAYATFGERFVEQIAGDFALALIDPYRSRLFLARDALGMRPLYYFSSPRVFVFASAIKVILAHPDVPTHPDDDVAGAWLFHGLAPESGRTYFKNISCVPAGHLLTVTRNRVVARRYWDFDPSLQSHYGSFREHAEVFRGHFERAVSRRLDPSQPTACFLSGGLDSSSVFCFAQALRCRGTNAPPDVFGISLVSSDGLTSRESDERAFLLEIERRYGASIERLPFKTMDFADRCRRAVYDVEAPFLDTHWPGYAPYRFLGAATKRCARVVLTGDWIEQMLGGSAYLVDLLRQFSWRSIRTHLRETQRYEGGSANGHWNLLARDTISRFAPRPVIRLVRRQRAFSDRFRDPYRWFTPSFQRQASGSAALASAPVIRWHAASAHTASVYRSVRSPYKTLFLDAVSKVASASGRELAFPFLDRELVSFLMQTPGDILNDRGTPKAILREAGAGVVPDPILRRRWIADSADFVDDGTSSGFGALRRVLCPDAMAVKLGYVSVEGVANARRLAQQASGCGISPGLRHLIAFELWLQTFFGDQAGRNLRKGERV